MSSHTLQVSGTGSRLYHRVSTYQRVQYARCPVRRRIIDELLATDLPCHQQTAGRTHRRRQLGYPFNPQPPVDETSVPSEEGAHRSSRAVPERLKALGIPSPTDWQNPKRRPATKQDVSRLYDVNPSFVDMLPWVEYLPNEQSMLLEDGVSQAAFFELVPIGTEGGLARAGTRRAARCPARQF